MKRYILLVGLYLFIAVLMAETGLFDLSFGQSMAEANTALLAKGFKETKRVYPAVFYQNEQIPGLDELEVRNDFQNGTVSGWTAQYTVKDKADITKKIISDLTAIHKKEPGRDRIILGVWTWEMDRPYSLTASLSEDRSILRVKYINDDVLSGWEEMWDYMDSW